VQPSVTSVRAQTSGRADRKRRGRASSSRLAVRLMTRFVLASIVLGLLGGGLAIPLAAAVGGGVNVSADLLAGAVDPVDPDLPQTSVLTAADGSVIASFYTENRTEVPLDRMSPWLPKAVVAIEDSRFYEHGAVDARGVLRALVNNQTGGATQGASTITQQYVKNANLEQATATGDTAAARAAVADTVERKLQDIKQAATLEQTLSKTEILTRYLNIVFFDDQTYGVEAAAKRYFGVSAAKLSIAQAATLAGMVQNPTALNPKDHPKAALARRNVVLGTMLQQKMITPAQYSKALATRLRVTGTPLPNGCANAKSSSGFFCEYVVQSIVNGTSYSALGTTAKARLKAIQTGGLRIRSSLDPDLQAAAVRTVNARVPRQDASGLGATAVTVEPGTGKVLAMAQNRTYSVTAGTGKTSVNYAVDRDLGGGSGFQTGSSFKPFTLATWLQAGHSLDETVDATERAFAFSSFSSCGSTLGGTQTYTPGNSEDTESGPMSVLTATARSSNVAYVDMESQLDLCDVTRTAESLGVHLAVPRQECSSTAAVSTELATCLPSLTLGVEPIAPLTMAAAYAGFAAGGTFCTPMPVVALTRPATDGDSRTKVAGTGADCTTALAPAVASGVNTALKGVLTEGTAAAVGPLNPWPSAGKTGTTNGPYDSWFVGYTAQRSTAVWVGDPGRTDGRSTTRRRLTDISVGGRYYPTIFGASIAAPIWKDLMTSAMRDLPAEPLP
jgi:membrane peptidoglycan carboxypeptidase